jgi:hypothetical protein
MLLARNVAGDAQAFGPVRWDKSEILRRTLPSAGRLVHAPRILLAASDGALLGRRANAPQQSEPPRPDDNDNGLECRSRRVTTPRRQVCSLWKTCAIILERAAIKTTAGASIAMDPGSSRTLVAPCAMSTGYAQLPRLITRDNRSSVRMRLAYLDVASNVF